MTHALRWNIVPGHEAQWRSEIFRSNAEGEIRIFQGDQCWHINATVNGHHYESSVDATRNAHQTREAAGRWLDRIIEVQLDDARRAGEQDTNQIERIRAS